MSKAEKMSLFFLIVTKLHYKKMKTLSKWTLFKLTKQSVWYSTDMHLKLWNGHRGSLGPYLENGHQSLQILSIFWNMKQKFWKLSTKSMTEKCQGLKV